MLGINKLTLGVTCCTRVQSATIYLHVGGKYLPSRGRGFVPGGSQDGFDNVLLKNKAFTPTQVMCLSL